MREWESVPRSGVGKHSSPRTIWSCFLGGHDKMHYKRAAWNELQATLGKSLSEWEDAPHRQPSEVIELVEQTIKRLREAGK